MNQQRKINVWDLPTRIFHWGLVIAIGLAWLTGDVLEVMEPHEWVGLAIVALVTFRLVWGFVGSTYARFGQFVGGKAAVVDYLKGNWQGVGHNPLGGWSVIVMLSVVIALVITGLFANNDADFTGPLAFGVNETVSSLLTSVHHFLFDVLVVLVVLHVGAMVVYKYLLGKDLIQPMIDGEAVAEQESDRSAEGGGWLAVVVAVAIALLAVWGASGVWHHPPAKPTVTATPDW